ncbi:MAG TPA: flagellar hook-length control protein [Sulfurimonas sp. UBA12504]|nr:MAG: hypothetical protein A2019_02230 [Sulfurimonas sp. GWF2_37_8]DAB30237.1 MAG TPA: flagellar hook-length control protein [Sulfurimonas sp. UBA12504]
MISLLAKSEPKVASPLGLSAKKEESTLSFSELLKGVGTKKEGKTIQNGALVLSLKEQETLTTTKAKSSLSLTQKETLSSLLKGEEKPAPLLSKEPLELNPKLTQNLSVAELKVIIKDAKEYLKEKIVESDGYKKAQIKELPTTLKGLVEVAKKFDIDISKITIQEVQTKTKEILQESIIQKESVKQEIVKEPNIQKEASKQEPRLMQLLKEVSEIKKEEKETPKTQNLKYQTQPTKAEVLQQTQVTQVDTQNVTVVKAQEIKTQEPISVMQLKETPLFKAQERSGHTTEQLVQSKQFKVEEKTPKEKADETFKLLLRGEKPTQNTVTATPDFSVATAKVLVSNTPSEGAKSFEQLLRGEEKENTNISKVDGLSVHKSDSFEVKLNEAKQMIKYLSSDVKTAIEDYKSPFTRVKVQLNPQRLGEVELTIVQRGKNLHVNISSNNAAINTLVLNANELKTQLSNNGINNASLNFSNNAQSDNSSAFGGQSQNKQHEQKAHEEYKYFGEESANEEIVSSLEIVVANYA